jgi:hypothetical protein
MGQIHRILMVTFVYLVENSDLGYLARRSIAHKEAH